MSEKNYEKQLYGVIASLKSPEEAEKFLGDLCTVQEIEHMAHRVESARLLMENKTYGEVLTRVGVSSATLSRVSKCVKYSDGYTTVLPSFFESEDKK